MLADQVAVEPEPVGTQGAEKDRPPPPRRSTRWGLRILIVLILVGGGGGAIYLWASAHEQKKKSEVSLAVAAEQEAEARSEPRVEVVAPQRGGMKRTTNQPGTIHAFDYAPLYAKVSGYVKTPDGLKVDRGSRVKKGELLLEIYDPELDAAVVQAEAELAHAKAEVAQATQLLAVAEAFARAAEARQNRAKADLEKETATRVYNEKQLKRFGELVRTNAIDQRLVDEQQDKYEASLAAEHAARAGIETAEAEYHEALARVEKAKADLVAAQADVEVSQAKLKTARVFQDYTKIYSPYDGVVIYRGEAVHPGAFIQAATQGTGEPLITVAHDDVMRTIIPIPDDDVPYCNIGDEAIIRLDALRGREFKGEVSRMAESEDIHDRTMRVEVDLPNPDHILKDGMFGRGEIILAKDTPNLTIPSTCLIDRNEQGEGTVLIVKDGKVHHQKVRVGRDEGLRAEILSGLDPKDQVILQPDTSMAEGTRVQVEAATPAAATPPAE